MLPFVGQVRILDRSEEPNAERAIRANYRWFRRIYLGLLTSNVRAHYVQIIPVDNGGRDDRSSV